MSTFRALPAAVFLFSAVSACGGIVAGGSPDAGAEGDASGTVGDVDSSTPVDAGADSFDDVAAACLHDTIGTGACAQCATQWCLQGCDCPDDPTLDDHGTPECLAYATCAMPCLAQDGLGGSCIHQCKLPSTAAGQRDGTLLLECLLSSCYRPCDLHIVSAPLAGGPGLDGGPCVGKVSYDCTDCCDTSFAAGAASQFDSVAACICDGGPCTGVCSGPGDYCTTPGQYATQDCLLCIESFAVSGSVCDPWAGTIEAQCQSNAQCRVYQECISGCQ